MVLTNFYPRPPRGGRLIHAFVLIGAIVFLSTPSARRATFQTPFVLFASNKISIHALREEGDLRPIVEPDQTEKFLSTPSARRATPSVSYPNSWLENFYPRPPRGGRQSVLHAARRCTVFLSTPSARRATFTRPASLTLQIGFLSTPSARRATRRPATGKTNNEFLSTPSARRATNYIEYVLLKHLISIHALREEGDACARRWPPSRKISIHALREEGDSKNRDKISIFKQIIQHSARI